MAKPIADDDTLPPERAAAQARREAELLRLLGQASQKPADLSAVERGLSARLSPNEENTLRRVAGAPAKLADVDKHHLARLVLLDLVTLDGTTVAVTALGKRRAALIK